MNIVHTQSSNEDLLCCRACLGTDCKLFKIQEYKLSEAFSRISGTPVSKDHFPQYLCTHCCSLLLKCTSFKDMCLQTEQFLERELLNGKLNTDCIRRIGRSHRLPNLTLSVVHTIDCVEHTEDTKKDPIDINNTDEPTIETAIKSEVNMEIDEVNLSEATIDEVNLGETTIDEVNLSGTTIDKVHLAPNTNLINLGAPNTDKAHIETVAIDSGKRKADSKIELVKMKDKAKITGNIGIVVGDVFIVNKMKTVKTYKRNIATVKKKMDIEIQAYTDKVNEELDKNESNIDLDTAMDKANKNVSYKSINTAYAGIINDDIGDSDIDDINEVKAHNYVVDVASILKKAKKTKKFNRNIGITAKKNIQNSKDNSDNADAKPVKQVKKRQRKERKIKYRNPENENWPEFDFAKFKSDYRVKIVTLSKQEQLEEIAARKQSANYTTAQFPCEECGKVFNMEPAYNNHRRRHSPLNTDCIRRIDRFHRLPNLTLSVVHTIDCVEHPHTEDIKKDPIDINNTDEPTIEKAITSKVNMEIDEVNLSETTIDEVNLSETTIDEVNLSESTIDEVNLSKTIIDEVNLSETIIDEVNLSETIIDEVNLSETIIDEVNLSETTIDEVNLSETTIDEVKLSETIIDEVNLSETSIDEVNLSETTIEKVHLVPNTNVINLGAPNTDKAHIETFAIDSGKREADSKIELVTKKDKAKIKDNIDNVVVVNKMKTIKTYKRNIATVKKTMDIEIQAYRDKVNNELDKNESNIDLDTATDKANKNVSYKSINTAYAGIINDDIGDSDIDDINEVEAHMAIVDVETILKKAVKKTKTCKRKIGITVKKNIGNYIDNSNNADEKPVKKVKKRRRKERKIKYRNPENDYLPEFDFAKFESDYGVKIVTLSKQEQLEEIAARKQSTNYTTAQFPCEECGKGFDMEPAYNNHRRRHSPSAGSHACEICRVRFKRACLRHRHQDLHKLKFVCECGFVSRARWTAKLHHEMHNGRRFVCKHCGKCFSKPTSYLTHVRLSHAALNVACGACGETFVSEHGLKLHATRMHSEIMKPQQFKCPTCSASFVSSDALNKHTDSGEHAGCPCEQCGESFASEEALQAHVGERHSSDSRRCEECRATFSSGAAFETHFRRKHLNQRYKPAAADRAVRKLARPGPRPPPPRGQFVCEQCGHIAPGAALLRYHQNGHLAVKPFACPECPKTFATNFLRNYHARTHKGEKPFKCSECSLAFTMKANLKRHHNVVHLGVHANAACHVCARVFTSKSSVRLHIDSVHNGQPWPRRNRRRKVAKD